MSEVQSLLEHLLAVCKSASLATVLSSGGGCGSGVSHFRRSSSDSRLDLLAAKVAQRQEANSAANTSGDSAYESCGDSD
jgi:hypothetical protein